MVVGHLVAKVGIRDKIQYSIPLIYAAALIPDLDFIFFGLVQHHTLTHSIPFGLLIYAPLLYIFRKKAVPYLIATTSHYLIADFITAKPALLYGLTTDRYGLMLTLLPERIGQEFALLSTFLVEFLIVCAYSIWVITQKTIPPLFSQRNDLRHVLLLGGMIFAIFLGALGSSLSNDLSNGLAEQRQIAYVLIAVEHIVFFAVLLKGSYRKEDRQTLPSHNR